MAQDKARDPRKEQQWRGWVQQWQQSGLSVRAFCDRHGLAEPTFYAWRRLLQQRQGTGETFLPVRLRQEEESAPTGCIEVVLAGGCRLRVGPGCDPATLRQLLAVLEAPPPC
jgi:transposase-like protein